MKAEVAQLVRAPDCGSGGHGFKSLPRYKAAKLSGFFIFGLQKNAAKFSGIFCKKIINSLHHLLDIPNKCSDTHFEVTVVEFFAF